MPCLDAMHDARLHSHGFLTPTMRAQWKIAAADSILVIFVTRSMKVVR